MGTSRWLAACVACFAAVQLGNAASKDESQFRKPVDCRNRPNGNFVWGCSGFYSICDNGNEVPVTCFGELVLNPKNNFCDHRANVPACKDPTATRNTLYRSKDPFTCKRKKDGPYPKDDCSSEYFYCNHAQLLVQRCPSGTVFDIKERLCQWPSELAACNGDEQSGEDDSQVVEQPQPKQTVPVSRPPQPPQQSAPVNRPPQQPQQPRQQPPPVHRRRIGAQFQYPAFQQPPQAPSVGAPIAQPIRDPAPQQPYPYQQLPPQDPAPIPTDPPATTRRPIGFDCSQRTDGYYPGQQCAKDYFACASGQAFEFQCPGDLVFDATVQSCDYPSECGQPRTTTTTAVPTTRRPVNFDCSSRTDGFYTNGPCTKDYFSCLGGFATAVSCPSGTVFDTLIESCDWPEVCGQPRTTPPPTTPPVTAVTRPVNFDCNTRTDGIYVDQPCQDHYFSCANGIAHQFNCAQGTLYDPNTNACEFADACGQVPTDPPAPADPPAPTLPAYVDSHGGAGYYFQPSGGYQQWNSPYGQGAPQQSFPQGQPPIAPQQSPSSGGVVPPSGQVVPGSQQQTQAPIPQTNFDCSNKADGFFEQGQCQQNYVRCANQIAFAQQCPDGLVFRVDICEFPADCANPAPPTAAAPVATTPTPTNASGLITTQQSDERCATLASGNHAVADCSQEYSSCFNGKGVRARCPGSLFYNPDNNFCDFRRNVVGCNGGANPGVPAVVPTAPVASDSGSQFIPPAGTTQTPVQPPSTFCQDNRKSNGFFGEACNSYFYSCDASGQTTRFLCPVGLFFDTDEGFCNHRELVIACGGRKPSTPAPTAPIPGNAALDAGVGIGQPATQAPSQFDCGTRSPGYYSSGCSSTYFSCAGGISIALSCPAQLLFSESTQRCDYRNSVPECGGSAPTTPAPVGPSSGIQQSQPAFPPAPQPQQPSIPQQPQQSPPAFPPAPQQPQPQPPQQLIPQAPQQPQPEPVLPPAPQQSQPPQFVPPPPQPQQPIVVQPQAPQQPFASAPQQQQPQQGAYSIYPQGPIRQSQGRYSCQARRNGIYGRPCSRFYFVCHNQRKYEFICPVTQAYSVIERKCTPQQQVPACTASSPYANVSPAPIAPGARHRHH